MADKSTSYDETTENIETRGYAFLQAACTINGITCEPMQDIHRLRLSMPNGDTYRLAATYQAVASDKTYHIDPALFDYANKFPEPSAVAFVILSAPDPTTPDVESAEIMITSIQDLPANSDANIENEIVYRTTHNNKPTVRFSMCKEGKAGTHMADDVLYRGGLSLRTDCA